MEDRNAFKIKEIKPPFTKRIKYRSSDGKPAHEQYMEHPSSIISLLNMQDFSTTTCS